METVKGHCLTAARLIDVAAVCDADGRNWFTLPRDMRAGMVRLFKAEVGEAGRCH